MKFWSRMVVRSLVRIQGRGQDEDQDQDQDLVLGHGEGSCFDIGF